MSVCVREWYLLFFLSLEEVFVVVVGRRCLIVGCATTEEEVEVGRKVGEAVCREG